MAQTSSVMTVTKRGSVNSYAPEYPANMSQEGGSNSNEISEA